MVSEARGSSSLLIDRQDRDPFQEVALGPVWLRQVAQDGDGSYLRLYRPRAAVAFSGKDCLEPGIVLAARAARDRSFAPVRRGVGGRAAAYHRGSVGMDHISAQLDGSSTIRDRFITFGGAIAQALQLVGIPAVVGPVPGEYCPGEFSINDGRGHKLVGTAQRLVRGAWLFSSMILVTGTAVVTDVLESVYPHLAMDWDPASVGSVEDLVPGISMDEMEAALLRAYANWMGPLLQGVPPHITRAAAEARSKHELPS